MNEEITLGTHDTVLGTEEKNYFSTANILNQEAANQIRRECVVRFPEGALPSVHFFRSTNPLVEGKPPR